MHKIGTMTQEESRESHEGPELESAHEFAHVDDGFERLWTPHRMVYLNGQRPTDGAGEGCPFCVVTGKDDAGGLIVYGTVTVQGRAVTLKVERLMDLPLIRRKTSPAQQHGYG